MLQKHLDADTEISLCVFFIIIALINFLENNSLLQHENSAVGRETEVVHSRNYCFFHYFVQGTLSLFELRGLHAVEQFCYEPAQ